MATWTTATRTWAAGETLTATNLNAQLRDFANGFGAWTSYTPVVSGWTNGNGTVVGYYAQVQKVVLFRARFTLGTTFTVAGTLTMTLPVTATSTAPGHVLVGYGTPAGSNYHLPSRIASTTTFTVFYPGTNGLYTNFTATTPATWASTNYVEVSGSYEAA